MAKYLPKPEEQQRAMLGPLERNYMLCVIMRQRESLDRARMVLTPEHFTPEEKWLSLLWLCVCAHVDEFDALPGKPELVARFNTRFDEDPDSYSDEDLAEADEFISALYALDTAELNDKVAFKWLRNFLEDRLVDRIRETLTSPMTPVSIHTNLASWGEQAVNYTALEGKRIRVAFPDNWADDEHAFIDKRETGLSFFDTFMDGGDAAGESYGLLGPFAGGKTTAAVMLTTERAVRSYRHWLEHRRQQPCGVAFHFSYEEGLGSLRLRALSYVAQIPRETLELALATKDQGVFSRTGQLKPYEQSRYRRHLRSGTPVQGELQRYIWAQRALNQCWRLVDMTGGDLDFPGRGSGLVDEVAAIVRQEIGMAARDGEQIQASIVLVDYVLACIERNTEDHEKLRHYIRNFPMQMKHKVAIPFNCPAWSMHQLDTKAQALAPGRMPNKTDASEGRAFAERLDFLFAIGNSTREGHAAFGPLKVRRTQLKPPIVVQIDGGNARILDKRDEFSINERSHRIVSNAEQRTIGGQPVEDTVNTNQYDADNTDATTMAAQQNRVRHVPRRAANGSGTEE